MAIADDISIDYTNKRIDYIGTFTGSVPDAVYTGKEFYTYVMDTFDELGQLDDSIPLSYNSPSATALQLVWENDWYGTLALHQALTGASASQTLTTSGAIRHLTFAAGGYVNAVSTDIGKVVTGGTTGDTGALLDYNNTTREWWIRPVDPATDLFDNGSEAVTIASGTGAGTMNAVSTQGETLYAEVRTIGTLNSADSVVYVEQNNARLTEWWSVSSHVPSAINAILPGAPHIDILLKVKDSGTLIDFGLVTVYQRKAQETYSSFVLNCSGGGNNTFALGTQNDTSDDGSGTAGTVTITFGLDSQDIDQDATVEDYAIKIDGGGQTALATYRDLKADTKIGGTTSFLGIQGQLFRGIVLKLPYTSETATFNEGATVTGGTSGATGIIVAVKDAGTTGDLYLTGVSGTFVSGEALTDDGGTPGGGTAGTPVSIAATEVCPFGVMEGAVFKGARGVYLTNISDANNRKSVDINGVEHSPPTTVSLVVSNLASGDRIGAFRLSGAGGSIIYSRLVLAAGNNVGNTTVVASTSIASDEPSAGYVRVGNDRHLYHYSSYATATFTLTSIPNGTATSTGTTTLTATGATFVTSGVKPGMMIRNTTDGSIAIVLSVDSETVITHTALTGGTGNDWGISDAFTINKLAQSYSAAEPVYIPILDVQATGTSVSNSLIYSADIPVLVRVRRYNGAGDSILEFEQEVTIGSTGVSTNAIRNNDEVVS